MHSGIGDEVQLKKYDIKVKENLPGVGKNLQDHHEVPFIARAKPGYGYFKQNKGLRMIRNGIQYLIFRSGPVTSNGVDCCSFSIQKIYMTIKIQKLNYIVYKLCIPIEIPKT